MHHTYEASQLLPPTPSTSNTSHPSVRHLLCAQPTVGAKPTSEPMDFASLIFAGTAPSSSPSTSEGKPKCLVEEDLLSLLGEDDGGVDCTLKLALPGGAAAPRRQHTTGADVRSVLQRHQGMLRPAGRCTMCGRTETPLWRHGPHGPKSLCNACGIRYKKEERQSRLTLGFPAVASKARS